MSRACGGWWRSRASTSVAVRGCGIGISIHGAKPLNLRDSRASLQTTEASIACPPRPSTQIPTRIIAREQHIKVLRESEGSCCAPRVSTFGEEIGTFFRE
jgi:hypothetical protein